MIFVDTNIFLRLLTLSDSVPEVDQVRGRRAGELFKRIELGEIEATVSEVVIHEVFVVMHADKHYRRAIPEIVTAMRFLVNLRGMRLTAHERQSFNAAFDLLESYPALGFADALIAVRSIRDGFKLATFDSHFDKVSNLQTWDLNSLEYS